MSTKTNLFVDGIPFAENEVASNQTSDESVDVTFLSSVRLLLDQKNRLVERDKLGQVERVLLRSTEYDLCTGFPAGHREFED